MTTDNAHSGPGPTLAGASGYDVGDTVVARAPMHNGLIEDGLGGYDARIGDVLRVVGFPSGPSIWDIIVENSFGNRFLCASHEVVRHNATASATPNPEGHHGA